MQRRLTIAFVAIAMAAIALVGLGVLLMTQVGARSDARARVDAQLETVLDIAETADNGEDFSRSLARIGNAFSVDVLQIVIIDGEGDATLVPEGGERRGRNNALWRLDSDQFQTFSDGEQVDFEDGRRVLSLQRLDVDTERRPRFPGADAQLGILIGEDVRRVPRQATGFFAASAAAVLLLALGAARVLAQRITDPIRSIEATTSAIAQGDLSARVDVPTNDRRASGRTPRRDEIAQLAESVNSMATDLDRSRALEQQFLLSVSHDLRTPLTAIRGYAEALEDGAASDAVATGSIITEHADRLSRLVTDLLQLARLDARSFTIETSTFDGSALAEEVLAGFRPKAEAVGVDLRLAGSGDPVQVRADRGRTAQILSNLVENGMKFAETTITIGVRHEQTLGADIEGEAIVIEVTDDGPGIAEADLPHVFERLYVANHQPKRAESSSGLGLAIVRELARAMGGTASASAGADGGTVMTIRLPAASPTAALATG